MSKETIWTCLRQLGLSEIGTAALMGNFECESGNEACRVEGDYDASRTKSKQYAAGVNNGTISAYTFAHDAKGWGLYQLTYYTRKEGFLKYCNGNGLRIESEQAQCEYCYIELGTDYPALLRKLLSEGGDLVSLTNEICRDFERPAINNYGPRDAAAQQIFNMFHGKHIENCSACQITAEDPPVEDIGDDTYGVEIMAPALVQGCKGRAVFGVQCMLRDAGYDPGIPDGDFGPNTARAILDLKQDYGLGADPVCDADVWQVLLQ